MAVAIQQGYVAAKDSESIELVLGASTKAIPDSIEKLHTHQKLMSNIWICTSVAECSTFSPKGLSKDKHLKSRIENMQKAGAESSFPNLTTAANVNEAMRILMRSRAQSGTMLYQLYGIKSVQDT